MGLSRMIQGKIIMKKFLIILQFASHQDFCRFYEQMETGRVVLPSSNPLPDHSRAILKLMIPGLEDPFLISGSVVSNKKDAPTGPKMTVDISLSMKAKRPELHRRLSGSETYRKALRPAKAQADAQIAGDKATSHLAEGSDTAAALDETDAISGLEMDISETEIQIMADSQPFKRGPVSEQKSSSAGSKLADYDLSNLRMENEEEDGPKKVDLSMATAFTLMEEDDSPPEEMVSPPSPGEPSRATPKDAKSEEVVHKSAADVDDEMEIDDDFSDEPRAGGVLFEDLKQMVTQDEIDLEPETEPDLPAKKIPEKKDLSPEERQKAEPVGKFFMNLTKAMLRSGYYAPGHPGADTAKAGLYEEFRNVLSGQREIMITNHTSRDGIDLMITGILDEPVSIRLLVGAGVAELFAPKLNEYCERKKLLSFALKQDISMDHFYQFIDIMSDPKVDNQKDTAAGKYLTNAFIARGITEISTVFVDDMVKLESDLPWRVEMAIHRLAKDLKVMPMFKGVSSDAIKQMKLQTVQDIIRPLKHPTFLNDFLVNCYIIADYIKTMAPEDIEEIVVEAFSMELLLPTSRFTFKELDHLKKLKQDHPDNAIIDRRINGIKRILKLISRRVVAGNEPGTRTFLEQLYQNEILGFNDLPEDVQYMINTMKIADDVRENFSQYIKTMASMRNPMNAPVYLKYFRRAVPALMDAGNWEELARITTALRKLSSRQPFASETFYSSLKMIRSGNIDDYASSKLFKSLEVLERLPVFIFKDNSDQIISAYEQGDETRRKIMDQILNALGVLGVDIYAKMLSESNDREVRKFCYEKMIQKGDHARRWAISILKDPGHPWFIHRNALMILAKVSDKPADFDNVRMFVIHANPKIREEVLNVAVALKPRDGESLVLGAIQDEDPKVRWRALRSVAYFSPVSDAAMEKLIEWIAQPLSKDKEADENQMSIIATIASAINAMPIIPMASKVETEILSALEPITSGKHSFWDKVKRAVGNDQAIPVLKAAIPLLGRIGSPRSAAFLKKTSRSYPDLADSIKKAMDQIKLRK